MIALALVSMNNARAIGISVGSGTYTDSWAISAGGNGDQDQHQSLPVAWSISPLNGGLTMAAASWNFVNTEKVAVWSGSQVLQNDGAQAGYNSAASAHSSLSFLLFEPVTYMVKGGLLSDVGEGGQSNLMAWIEKYDLSGDGRWMDIYTEVDRSGGARFPLLSIGDGQGVSLGSATGILEPGKYLFNYLASIGNGVGGDANGSFSFTMTRNVPDSGSTLMLLGFALSALGILTIARPRRNDV